MLGARLGWVIDCPEDPSPGCAGDWFDQTFILDNPMARGPVMATLYHYVEGLIDGRRLLFVIDEFWKSLLDDSFPRPCRRQAAHPAEAELAGHPRHAVAARCAVSSIAHTVRDQCPSQIFFANGQATEADFGKQVRMGLTAAELEVVRSLPEGTGEFLLKQGRFSVRAQLPWMAWTTRSPFCQAARQPHVSSTASLRESRTHTGQFPRSIEQGRRQLHEKYLLIVVALLAVLLGAPRHAGADLPVIDFSGTVAPSKTSSRI